MMKKSSILIGGIVALLSVICSAHATDWSRDGEFLIDTNVVNFNSQHEPANAFDGTNYFVVWHDNRNGSWDIYGARVSPTGVVLDQPAIAISTAAAVQKQPAVAFDGTNYFVVWQDDRTGSWDVYGARISQSGILLDTAGTVVSDIPGFYGDETAPSIAFGATNYLVAWRGGWDIYAARVTQSGVVLDTTAIPLDTSYWDEDLPDIAFDGSNFQVVWDKWTYSSASGHLLRIRGARVSQSGTVLNTNHIAGDRASEPSICFDGTNYVVVWTHGLDSLGIYARHVSQEGLPIDPSVPICTEAGKQEKPSAGFDGSNYIIVWQDRRSGDWDIRGAEVDTSCSNIDEFAVSLQSGTQSVPALAHGQNDQVLITWSGWTDSINGNYIDRMRIWGKFYPPVGIEEYEGVSVRKNHVSATIISGPLRLPEGKECRVFDITGRVVAPDKIRPGIYFIEVEGTITHKVVKVR